MADDKETFLSRWSRLKRATVVTPPEPSLPGPTPAPVDLPPVESLDFSSDFSGFLRADVDKSVRRVALAKLFHSPHFNEMDGLDVYIDDYNKFEPLTQDMLAKLDHVRDLLRPDDVPEDETGQTTQVASAQPADAEQDARSEQSPHVEGEKPQDGAGDAPRPV